MTPKRLLCLSLAAASVLAFTQCSTPTPPSPQMVAQPDIVLTSAHRSSMDLTLVSVSHDKLVTLRMPDGKEATAHVGETFKAKDGTEWTGYSLQSASRHHKQSKVVVGYKAALYRPDGSHGSVPKAVPDPATH